MVAQTCRTCGVEKPLSEYWKQTNRKSGFQSECRSCMGGRQNRWRRNNRERAREISNNALKKTRRGNPVKAMLAGLRWRARQLGLEFNLSPSDIVIPEKCPVLGIPLKSAYGQSSRRIGYDRDCAPSVDRIDNSRGYTRDNIIVVSFKANRIKSNASVDELEAVANFYRRLMDDDSGRVDSYRACADKALSGNALHDLSAVLSLPEEKGCEMSIGNGRGRPFVEVPVPPLPMAGD